MRSRDTKSAAGESRPRLRADVTALIGEAPAKARGSGLQSVCVPCARRATERLSDPRSVAVASIHAHFPPPCLPSPRFPFRPRRCRLAFQAAAFCCRSFLHFERADAVKRRCRFLPARSRPSERTLTALAATSSHPPTGRSPYVHDHDDHRPGHLESARGSISPHAYQPSARLQRTRIVPPASELACLQRWPPSRLLRRHRLPRPEQ